MRENNKIIKKKITIDIPFRSLKIIEFDWKIRSRKVFHNRKVQEKKM